MTGTTPAFIPLRTGAILLAIVLAAACLPVLAQGPAKPAAKPKPCGKDQVELTSKITGATHCATMGDIVPMWGGPGPQPINPKKPAAKPKK